MNRIWQHHFGRGIVGTANNFGAKGDHPTHPELLDWLSRQFLAHGGRSKPLHRLILMSDVYRRSAAHPNPQLLGKIDPTGKWLASFRPRRLTAEELRDTLLMVTGELNPEMGGVPVMPEINLEVALEPRMIQFSIAPAYQPSRTPEERNRRSIYSYRVRGQADPFMEVMNLPNPNESCEVRDVAAVSPQAFTLMNSDVMTDRSIAFAQRLMGQQADTRQQVKTAFQLAYGRQPDPEELQSLTRYVQEMVLYHKQHKPEAEFTLPKSPVLWLKNLPVKRSSLKRFCPCLKTMCRMQSHLGFQQRRELWRILACCCSTPMSLFTFIEPSGFFRDFEQVFHG